MKTTEEKAKAYEEAIDKVAHFIKKHVGLGCMIHPNSSEAKELFNIFPELKESEDERMMNNLHSWMKEFGGAEEYTEKVYQWIKGLLEKQDKQKPADKVVPKFHEGDWVVSPNGVYWHIDKISNSRYEVTSNTGESSNWPLDTNIYHKFNIQDAKDGDVLCCESGWTCIFKALDNPTNTFSSYCFMDSDKWFCNTGSEGHTLDKAFIKAYNGEIHPATKEQRDLIFQKMKEAGYEWDAEKKELKDIQQKPAVYVPKFRVGNKLVSTKNPRLSYEILEVGHINELGNPEYKVEIFTDGKQQYPSNIHYMECYKVDEWAKLIEQKHDWNEEDEEELKIALNTLEKAGQYSSAKWLKNVCLVPQTMQKPWSEEDEKKVATITDTLLREKYYHPEWSPFFDDQINWLKSLKDRVQPEQDWI